MAKQDVISPEEFEKRMRACADNSDQEVAHSDADDMLCQVLVSLGYHRGVAVFQDMDKWYA